MTTTPTWNDRERKILTAIVAAEEAGTDAHVAARSAVELDDAIFCRTIERLDEAGYIDAAISKDGAGRIVGAHVRRALPAALREVGSWPSNDPYESLLAVLQEQIDGEANEERRSKLVRLREGVVGVGRDVGVSVLTAYIKQQAGL